MPCYRTTFERFHFGFNPPLHQLSDVVFDTDVPFDDEHLDVFIDTAWSAMWQQNPQWKSFQSPISSMIIGWSSILGGREYTEIHKE